MPSISVVFDHYYDSRHVVPPIPIAAAGACAALDPFQQLRSSRGTRKLAWLTGGSIAVGFGIWGMDVGMGVFRLPTRCVLRKGTTNNRASIAPQAVPTVGVAIYRPEDIPRDQGRFLLRSVTGSAPCAEENEFKQRVHDDAKT
jgi:NO-binding membrane sensor protein with MHYT domain